MPAATARHMNGHSSAATRVPAQPDTMLCLVRSQRDVVLSSLIICVCMYVCCSSFMIDSKMFCICDVHV